MKITKRQLRRIIREEAAKMTDKYDDDPALAGDQDELPDHLQKGIIDKAEEKPGLSEQLAAGSRIRGLHLDDAMSERAKTLMTHLYNNAVTDIIAEEGVLEEEAEEMAIVGVVEVFKEFLDSVGHRYIME